MLEGLKRIAKGESNIDFIGRTRLWFSISAVVLAASILGLTVGGLEYGLEFKGGTSFRVPIASDAGVSDLRGALERFGISESAVQIQTPRGAGAREAHLRFRHVEDRDELAAMQAQVARVAGQVDSSGEPLVDEVSIDDVGPNWGRQVSNKALRGLIVFLVLVVIYISIRFEPKMAVAALIALFHDLTITAGLYAIIGFIVTPATVIALLTLLGYSLYDTVVVFDRVRENTATLTAASRMTYSEMVNRSVNQVVMRSLNTSLTSLLPVGALLIVATVSLGVETLSDLALALFLGILVGSYSSIFLAPPILALWKEREPRHQAIRTRLATGGGRMVPATAGAAAGGARAPAAMPPVGEGDEGAVATQTRPRPAARPGSRPPPRARRRRRGKRRR